MKRAISVLINLIVSISVFSASLCTVNATPTTYRYKECGDYFYSVSDDGTACIEDYKGTATSVDIPTQLDGYKVTSLGDLLFFDEEKIEEVTIHKDVTTISYSTFHNCTNLYEIKIDSENPVYDSRENCNAVIESETNTLIAGCNGTIIPESVKIIGSCAFLGCTNLKYITIPKGVTSISGSVFIDCENLSSVKISESVTNIVSNPFSGCGNLSEIKIDSNNPTYDSRESCNAIIESETNTLLVGCKDTVIHKSVKAIGKEAFYNCENLKAINIPQGVTSIGDYAFSGCKNLASITISESVASIGEAILYDCINLSEIKVDSNNPTYDSRRNCNAIIESETNTLFAGCKDTVIPESITSVGAYAFFGCENLESITIPDSVTVIDKGAFYGCTNLNSITIPDNVVSIGDDAFSKCSSLEFIIIPDNVVSIGDYAFSNCENLKSIMIPKKVSSIGENAFLLSNENVCLYVFENSYAHTYAEASDCSYELMDSLYKDIISGTTEPVETIVPEVSDDSDDSVNKDREEAEVSVFRTGAVLLCVAILIAIEIMALCVLVYIKYRNRFRSHK